MCANQAGGRATCNASIANECGHRRFVFAGRQRYRENRPFTLAGHGRASPSNLLPITVPSAYSAQFRILPRFFPRIAGRNVVPPCRRFLPAGLLRELVAASRDEHAESFRFVRMEFPGASLLGGFASLIGRFISLFARLGNSRAAARRFNDLRAFGRPPGRPGVLPVFSRGRGKSRVGTKASGRLPCCAHRRSEQSAVGRRGRCVALSPEQPASEERRTGVTAILSLGRRS